MKLDFIAGFFELLGLYLVGKKLWYGFTCNIIGCICWIIVAVDTKVYGLLLVVIPAIYLNGLNVYRWLKGK